MNQIYDIILNFTDTENLLDFYEWNNDDYIDNLKEIPIIRIDSNAMIDIINYQLQVDNHFLKQIENKTISFTKEERTKYATLVTDLNRVVALEFSNNGIIISRSTLLLDEEEDTINEATNLKIETIKYKKIRKYNKKQFLTRKEISNQNFIIHELDNIYENKLTDQINYIYEELFDDKVRGIEKKYLRLKDLIQNNYSSKVNNFVEDLKLAYKK